MVRHELLVAARDPREIAHARPTRGAQRYRDRQASGIAERLCRCSELLLGADVRQTAPDRLGRREVEAEQVAAVNVGHHNEGPKSVRAYDYCCNVRNQCDARVMWVPRTEDEIKAAMANGVVRESATFDAKAALPAKGKNKDLARDICAMTIDGGALLYGIGGADPTRPDELSPFELGGASERVDQVAQSAIAEPPTIEIHDIVSADQAGAGYLLVAIPASPRTPHMVTLDRDNRYYGRGATGNRILTEGEVARLYARRDRWEIGRDELLDGVIAEGRSTTPSPVTRSVRWWS